MFWVYNKRERRFDFAIYPFFVCKSENYKIFFEIGFWIVFRTEYILWQK